METDVRLSFVANSQGASKTDSSQSLMLKSASSSDNKSFEKTLNDKRSESSFASKDTESTARSSERNKADRKNDKKTDLKSDASTERRKEEINSKNRRSDRSEKSTEKNPSETAVREGYTEKDVAAYKDAPEITLSEAEATEAAQKIAELCDVTLEELQGALDKLGLTIEQLADFENLKKLMMELNDVTDAAELLKIPGLLEAQKTITGIVNEAVTASQAGTQAAGAAQATQTTQAAQSGATAQANEGTEIANQGEAVDESLASIDGEAVNEDVKASAKQKDGANVTEGKVAKADGNQNALTDVIPDTQSALTQAVPDEATKTDKTDVSGKMTAEAADEVVAGANTKTAGEAVEAADTVDSGAQAQPGEVAKNTANQSNTGKGNHQQSQSEQQNAGTAIKPGDAQPQSTTQTETGINMSASSQKTDESAQASAAKTPQSASRFTLEQSKDILNQLADKMKLDLKPGISELKINLRPADLGNVTVRIVTESGHVTAEIVTENSKIKELVEQNLPTLKETLKQQGVDVGELSVSVGQQEQGETMKQFMGEQTKSRARMSQIVGRVMGEDGELEPINYANESEANGSTVNYSA